MRLIVTLLLLAKSIIGTSQILETPIKKVDYYTVDYAFTRSDSNYYKFLKIDLNRKILSVEGNGFSDEFNFNWAEENTSHSYSLYYIFNNFSSKGNHTKVELIYEPKDNSKRYLGTLSAKSNDSYTEYILEDFNKTHNGITLINFLRTQLKTIRFDWIKIGLSVDSTLHFFRSTPVSVNGNIVKVWTKRFEKKFKDGDNTYENVEIKSLVLCDCKNNKMSDISSTVYDMSGNVVYSVQPKLDWSYVIPDSIGEMTHSEICNRFIFKKK